MPSPGMVTTVCFAIRAVSPGYFMVRDCVVACDSPARSPEQGRTRTRDKATPLQPYSSPRASRPRTHGLNQPQAFCDQVLHALRDHQRLRHAAERWERKFFSAPCDYAGHEIDGDRVARNDRLFLPGNLFGELLAQLFYQFRNFDA